MTREEKNKKYREYYKKNKEKENKRYKKWYEANKDKKREINKKYKSYKIENIEKLEQKVDKYKEVIDKIKEYCELNKEFTPRLEDILELLEEPQEHKIPEKLDYIHPDISCSYNESELLLRIEANKDKINEIIDYLENTK